MLQIVLFSVITVVALASHQTPKAPKSSTNLRSSIITPLFWSGGHHTVKARVNGHDLNLIVDTANTFSLALAVSSIDEKKDVPNFNPSEDQAFISDDYIPIQEQLIFGAPVTSCPFIETEKNADASCVVATVYEVPFCLAGVCLERFGIFGVTEQERFFTSGFENEQGNLGLAFPGLENQPRLCPDDCLDVAGRTLSKAIGAEAFALHMCPAQIGEQSGHFLMGKLDSLLNVEGAKYGGYSTVSVVGQVGEASLTYWVVDAVEISIDKRELGLVTVMQQRKELGEITLIDSGSPYVELPPELFERVAGVLSAAGFSSEFLNGSVCCKPGLAGCGAWPELFGVGLMNPNSKRLYSSLHIPFETFLAPCSLAGFKKLNGLLRRSVDPKMLTLGVPFLQHFYTVFSHATCPPTISFAPNNCTDKAAALLIPAPQNHAPYLAQSDLGFDCDYLPTDYSYEQFIVLTVSVVCFVVAIALTTVLFIYCLRQHNREKNLRIQAQRTLMRRKIEEEEFGSTFADQLKLRLQSRANAEISNASKRRERDRSGDLGIAPLIAAAAEEDGEDIFVDDDL